MSKSSSDSDPTERNHEKILTYFLELVFLVSLQQAKLRSKRICEDIEGGDGTATTVHAALAAEFYHRYTHRTRDETPPSESVPWIFNFGGTTGAESHRRWLIKWLWCS